jgi:hypothetical protein
MKSMTSTGLRQHPISETFFSPSFDWFIHSDVLLASFQDVLLASFQDVLLASFQDVSLGRVTQGA